MASAAACWPRSDMAVPSHAVAAGGIQLPPPADLFALWRRGDRAFRAVGRRLDDVGTAVTLPALGHFGHRQRARTSARRRALVSAMAVRPLARRQRALHFVGRIRHRPYALIYGFPSRRAKSMRWKTGRGGPDPRHLDLIATFALLVAIIGAWHFFSAP